MLTVLLFSGRAHTDCLLNNLCEVFNGKIDDGREQPIITCLEYIREYCMRRMCIVQKKIDSCHGRLTPTASDLFEAIKKEAAKYTAVFAGSGKYQVGCQWEDQFVVNFNDNSCSCRHWEITGMPCKHAVSAIWDRTNHGEDVPVDEEWVHNCYTVATWKAMYENKIEPINGR